MKYKFVSVFLMFVFLAVLLSGCAPAPTQIPPTESAPTAGTVEGKMHFNSEFFSASVHPCEITEFSPDTSVDAADIDWSGLVSNGWSRADGFQWQGDIHASGFTCTIDPNLKFELGKQIAAGDEKSFTFVNVPSGKFAIVVILTKPTGETPQLIYNENNVPKVFDLTAEHGIDIGFLTVGSE